MNDLQPQQQQNKAQETSKKQVRSNSQSISSKQSKQKKKKRDDQRSRSHKKEKRSRSKQQKKKKKQRHRDSKRRSYSRDSSSDDSRRDRDRDRNRHRRNKYYDRKRPRSRDRNRKIRKQFAPKEALLPTQIPMPPIPGESRKRQRSKSPLGYYRRNQNANQQEFWDSFSWVPKLNYIPNVSSSALVNTKKMRRLMITNIPYEIGITDDDLRQLITRYMSKNYLKDQMNNCPVVNLEPNREEHNVAVELSSVEETCRICKLDKVQLFQGWHNGIIRLGDSMYGNNVVTQAQNAAKAQAAAFAAITVLENKKTNFNLDGTNKAGNQTSTLIRVVNGVTPYMCGTLNEQQWNDYHEDLYEGFANYGTIVHFWLVKKSQSDICADAGNLFVEYQTKQYAQYAMSQMNGRIYDERKLQVYYVPRDLYYKNFKKGITPPVLPTIKAKPTPQAQKSAQKPK